MLTAVRQTIERLMQEIYDREFWIMFIYILFFGGLVATLVMLALTASPGEIPWNR